MRTEDGLISLSCVTRAASGKKSTIDGRACERVKNQDDIESKCLKSETEKQRETDMGGNIRKQDII